VFTLKHNSLTNLGGNLSDHCQRKDMDKDNVPASQQINNTTIKRNRLKNLRLSTHIFGD